MIELEQVSLVIDGTTILDRLSFRIAEGEAVALVGPNGSGKSSVLRAILGLVPFRGRIRIGGHDVLEAPIAARERLGYLPQRPAFGQATGREVLHFAADLRRLPRSGVAPVLERVGLLAHADQAARTYSGGMQQRLSFALALLSEAPVLLLDEPTASLDRDGQANFERIALELRAAGRTLLLALHRSDEISRLASRVLQLEAGRLIEGAAVTEDPRVLPLRRLEAG